MASTAIDRRDHDGGPERSRVGALPAARIFIARQRMKCLVILPGRAPHWVADHARHLAQRLTETGRVMVVFTGRRTNESLLPGQPGNGSVLGHSVAGYPIWMGRRRAALGLHWSTKFTIIGSGRSNTPRVWALALIAAPRAIDRRPAGFRPSRELRQRVPRVVVLDG